MFGYNWKFLVTHPWVWLREIRNMFKYAWQRAVRGYDDEQTWNIDRAISDLLAKMLTQFKRESNGIPLRVLDEIYQESTGKGF